MIRVICYGILFFLGVWQQLRGRALAEPSRGWIYAFQPLFLGNRLNSLPDDWRKKTTQLQAQSHHREDLTYNNSSLRGANKVADNFTKMENTNKNGHVFVSFQKIPNGAKGPYQLDKSQMLSIRLIYDKVNFFLANLLSYFCGDVSYHILTLLLKGNKFYPLCCMLR